MKIFSASQIRACDAYTIHSTKIQSHDLMERAAGSCLSWINENLPNEAVFMVICGSGNNGGDGLAITRMLHRQGYNAKAFLMRLGDSLSDDCRKNFERLTNIDQSLIEILEPESLIADVPENVIIIDAILGTGLNRPAEGWVAEFIEHLNELTNLKISIDIPSGMPADSIPKEGAAILRADHTLSFQFYKRSFLHRETGEYAGDIHILDIGLSDKFISSTQTSYTILDRDAVSTLYTRPSRFNHKGDNGLAYIVAGSHGMMGAAVLSVKAALRAGAGKVQALVPECGYTIMQTSVPEAMCSVSGETYVSRVKGWEKADMVGVGPGLGMASATQSTFSDFIIACKNPIVVDADGLNIMAEYPELLGKLPANSIITPHPKEFEKLFGKTPDSMQQCEVARTKSMKYNIYIVLKGHHTIITTPEGDCIYNSTGNAGMATGGSGDVLTGIITGLCAQGYKPAKAVKLGVYLHGLAGDYAAAENGENAMIASDIIDNLGKSFKQVGG